MSNIINQTIQFNEDVSSSESAQSNEKNNFLQAKFTQIIDNYPHLTPDQAFYLEYCKLYIQTLKIQQQVSKTKVQVQRLRGMVNNSTVKQKKTPLPQLHSENSNTEKKKRIRRTANEIARHYTCKVEKCQKSYGSEGSLNQHIKLKHKQLYETGAFPF